MYFITCSCRTQYFIPVESIVGEGSHGSSGGQEGLHEGAGAHQEEAVEVLRSREVFEEETETGNIKYDQTILYIFYNFSFIV